MTFEELLANFASGEALISPTHAERFKSCLQAVAGEPQMAAELARARSSSLIAEDETDEEFWGAEEGSWRASLRPYVVKDGILQVPVFGVLLHRFPYNFGGWATGYSYIERALRRGENDGNVKGYALICDSPGGMVAGCFELCDVIHAELTKPVRAFAADSAYSAAYALASQAERVSVASSGGVGSVGVVTLHTDYSEALKQFGVKVTFIYAGKHKVEGNAYEALSDEAKARIQARIDKKYGIFVSTVARGRAMEEKAVRATEALCYEAEDAVEVGFADAVESAKDGLIDYFATLNSDEDDMSAQNQDTGKKFGQAEMDAATADARREGEEAGAKRERERMSAILTCENAAGRESAAIEMALDTETSFSASTANKHLARMPKTEAAASAAPAANTGKSHFEEHMDKTATESVGAEKGGKAGAAPSGDTPEDADAAIAARVSKNYQGMTGHGGSKS